MTIRPFENSDIDFLVKSIDLGFTDGWNKEMIESAIKGGRFLGFIAENNEKIGYLSLSRGLDGEFDLEDIFVLPNYRGRGVGYSLIKRFLETENPKKVFLEVRENNQTAISLYKKFGFNIVSKRNKYYSDGETALVMIREI